MTDFAHFPRPGENDPYEKEKGSICSITHSKPYYYYVPPSDGGCACARCRGGVGVAAAAGPGLRGVACSAQPQFEAGDGSLFALKTNSNINDFNERRGY